MFIGLILFWVLHTSLAHIVNLLSLACSYQLFWVADVLLFMVGDTFYESSRLGAHERWRMESKRGIKERRKKRGHKCHFKIFLA